jgi:Asp-tRNA(Asn)/Glu-tRNA(Gln) amidotransferase A subunit family amidase
MPTLRELAADVSARRVGAHELASESLRRIEELDPGLGAVVAIRAEEALDDAKGLDATLAGGGHAGPLAGLPLLVKDMTDVAGMRTTFGSLVFADAPPAVDDALVVARLRRAGAIVVGKTNMPEFAAEGFTSNLLFGPTRNPWNPERTPGGSSGGSGGGGGGWGGCGGAWSGRSGSSRSASR